MKITNKDNSRQNKENSLYQEYQNKILKKQLQNFKL